MLNTIRIFENLIACMKYLKKKLNSTFWYYIHSYLSYRFRDISLEFNLSCSWFFFLNLCTCIKRNQKEEKIKNLQNHTWKMFAIIEKMFEDKTESKQNRADFIISKSDVWHQHMAYFKKNFRIWKMYGGRMCSYRM